MSIFAWQEKAWGSVMDMRQRMPHALLLQGRAGIGKVHFARQLAQALLCDSPSTNGHACGNCASCGWFQQENHPDFRLLEPEDAGDGSTEGEEPSETAAKPGKPSRKKHLITVHQVRGLMDFFSLSTHRQGLRIVLLHPAENLNPAAANALLKMLEEPPPATLFLLVSHQPQQLLPTIRSRCNKFTLSPPDVASAASWLADQGVADVEARLAYAGGSPLHVLEEEGDKGQHRLVLFQLLQQGARLDPLPAAAHFAKDGIPECISLLQKWTHDMMLTKCGMVAHYHVVLADPLQHLAKSVSLPALLAFQRTLDEARRLAHHPLNAELQLESLLIQYTQMFQGQTFQHQDRA